MSDDDIIQAAAVKAIRDVPVANQPVIKLGSVVHDGTVHDIAAAVVAAVRPLITRRDRAETADKFAAIEIPRPTLDSGAYEYWRGYRAARNEIVEVLRHGAGTPPVGVAGQHTDTPEATDDN